MTTFISGIPTGEALGPAWECLQREALLGPTDPKSA